jgi:DNA-binding LacI/PurR family transcriptional regulator
MATIRQIAQACNVSPMTVSFVLNNRPGQVSDETRERVLRSVRDLGYQPRVAHRRPKEAEPTINTVGIALGRNGSRLGNAGYHQFIVNAVYGAAEEKALNVLLFHGGLFHEDPRHSIRTYFDGRCEGLLVIAPSVGMPLVDALRERGIAFALIGDQGDGEGIASVDVDNVTEARGVVEYLVGLGHRRIAFIGGPDFVRSAVQRREGYRLGLLEHDLPYRPEWDIAPLNRDYLVYERVVQLMSVPKDRRPTAIFGWNDGVVLRAMNVLTDMGVRVREEVSLIGIDDVPQASVVTPSVTTLRQPYREIGARALEVLMERIHSPKSEAKAHYLPCRLIERDSTAPPPPGARTA